MPKFSYNKKLAYKYFAKNSLTIFELVIYDVTRSVSPDHPHGMWMKVVKSYLQRVDPTAQNFTAYACYFVEKLDMAWA